MMKQSKVKWLRPALWCLVAGLGLTACSTQKKTTESEGSVVSSMQMESLNPTPKEEYKTAYPTSTYEVFLYSFYDSDGDGIGDIRGLIEKLDYINDGKAETTADLGIKQIWLMPVSPSPSYHKYDVTDYMGIDPQYGTMEDFKALLQACHERGIRLITDLVLNHSSDEHPWFLAAKKYLEGLGDAEPNTAECPYVDYYHFSRKAGAGYTRLNGTEWYYEARFSPDMPDLNLDLTVVREEIRKLTDFWLDLGLDGFRLDACSHFYEGDTKQNTAFLSWLGETVKSKKPDAFLVGEVWEDQSIYSQYYASGLSFFDFAFSAQREQVIGTADGRLGSGWWLAQSQAAEALYDQAAGKAAVNAPFYTNHDLNRAAGYFPGDDGKKVKFGLGLHLTRPGNTFLYYGEELGMKGSGKDENKRAPMYWSEQADTKGLCQGPPKMDAVKMKFPAADDQQADPTSIRRYTARAIGLRNAFPAIALGRTDSSDGWSTDKVFICKRQAEGFETVWLAANCSAEEQTVTVGDDLKLAAALNVDDKQVVLSGNKLTIPARHIAVLQKAGK